MISSNDIIISSSSSSRVKRVSCMKSVSTSIFLSSRKKSCLEVQFKDPLVTKIKLFPRATNKTDLYYSHDDLQRFKYENNSNSLVHIKRSSILEFIELSLQVGKLLEDMQELSDNQHNGAYDESSHDA